MKKVFFIIVLYINAGFIFSQDITREYFGTVYKTVMTDSRVNIRSMPSIHSKILGQKNTGDEVIITGISSHKDFIDNFNGYWLRISLDNQADRYWAPDNGWIFSKYVKIDRNLEAGEFKLKKVHERTERKSLYLILSVTRHREEYEINVYPDKLASQNFYTFTWSDDAEDFYYTDPVGTFSWYPENNMIKRITYLGYGCESAWCLFSDDFRYMFQDYGTSPGPRGLGIFDLQKNTKIFSGTYYRDLEYRDNAITVIRVYNEWAVKHKNIDKESIHHAEAFMEKTPKNKEVLEWEKEGFGTDIIVRYRFNLNTRNKTFIDCRYIATQ